jgi:nitrite reductase/ring-hydroxylating ferredoxin subunit
MSSGGFVKVASTSDIPEGRMKTVTAGAEDVLVANVGGTYYAIGAICKHREWDLSEGTLEGETVVCAGHGSRWNLKTGEGTFTRPLPSEPVYEVKVEGSDILVKAK